MCVKMYKKKRKKKEKTFHQSQPALANLHTFCRATHSLSKVF